MAATYDQIASYTVSTAVDTVTFSALPQTFTDLIVISNFSLSGESLYVRFNSDTGSNYSATRIIGNGSSASSSRGSNQTAIVAWGAVSTNQASGRTTSVGQVLSYANTNVYKTALSEFSHAGQEVNRTVGLWRSTAAITSLSLTSTNASWKFSAGDTFSLFGVKAA